jgi:organic radical activating enzyme
VNKILVHESYNYIEAYLTFACTYKCHYCINNYSNKPVYTTMKADEWIRGLNRIQTREDLPITLGGGEPTIHPNFYTIVKNIRKDIHLDLLTNGTFDIREFMREIPPDRFKRNAKYASIRFSYHPGYTDTNILLAKVCRMKQEGYSVGIWAVEHPEAKRVIRKVKKIADDIGIDFRLKEFLGEYKGKLYGHYKYLDAITGKKNIKVKCYPSEILISPQGDIFRCHYELYHKINPLANIADKEISLGSDIVCCNYGLCHLCDIKNKYDRFQRKNWCSVRIEKC